MSSFAVQKLVSLIRSRLFIFTFVIISVALGDPDLREHCHDLSENVLPMLSSSSLIAMATVKSLSYLSSFLCLVEGCV